MRLFFTWHVIVCAPLLVIAASPGSLENLLFAFPFVCLWFLAFGIWAGFAAFLSLRDVILAFHAVTVRPDPPRPRGWWAVASVGVVAATMALVWFHVPQRIGFAFSHAGMRELVDSATTDKQDTGYYRRRAGAYTFDSYAADKRGGVFFRTNTGPDGIGPDEMSYGFAYQPNGKGSPFGNASYSQCHLFGDWYAFSASNDW